METAKLVAATWETATWEATLANNHLSDCYEILRVYEQLHARLC